MNIIWEQLMLAVSRKYETVIVKSKQRHKKSLWVLKINNSQTDVYIQIDELHVDDDYDDGK